ncbi:hypothetical protein L2E82_13946 [Cichorium intybus]|uniref:Uncharacterized protein n=1 Tax=Cichorium intybus TaxID=13427 RepID=A0ACB9EZ89_CICIN|nr:hypothetical protein L2E82_13946 [Cichorium intybus]
MSANRLCFLELELVKSANPFSIYVLCPSTTHGGGEGNTMKGRDRGVVIQKQGFEVSESSGIRYGVIEIENCVPLYVKNKWVEDMSTQIITGKFWKCVEERSHRPPFTSSGSEF